MIVVFGSVNLDIVTAVSRIAGPGETVLGPSYASIPGGKGANQALAARRAGAAVRLIGATGADAFAAAALALLEAAGVDLSGLRRLADRPTGAAFISVDAEGQNAITVAAGANAAADGRDVADAGMAEGDLLLLQRETSDEANRHAARAARERGARVVLNLAPAGRVGPDDLADVDILVANEFEAATLAEQFGTGDALEALAGHLGQTSGTDLVVTLGPEGVVGWSKGRFARAASLTIEPVDTTGAGDTFVGAFAAALEDGSSFEEALRRGAAAGSLACTRHGAQPSIPTAAEVTHALKAS